MNIGKAVAICKQIDNEKYSQDEKVLAIYLFLKMPTHNGFTKDNILNLLKYLVNITYEIK